MADFKPNIYPIIYWGLLFGLIAGFILFVLNILSQFITILWFPVFLGGVIWGGYRNYQKQRHDFSQAAGQPLKPKPVLEEFKDAAHDIVDASREMLAEERQREAGVAESPPVSSPVEQKTEPHVEENKPYQPPAPPSVS